MVCIGTRQSIARNLKRNGPRLFSDRQTAPRHCGSDGPMLQGLMEMARHGQAVVLTPFTLSGAMSPATNRRRAG
jgi:trimethylamine:corrinoid methyltransferase-like protein